MGFELPDGKTARNLQEQVAFLSEKLKDLYAAFNELGIKKIEIVDELPETGQEGTLYLVAATLPDVGDIYEEYIWYNESWERIGSTQIDLSNYYTKTEADLKYFKHISAPASTTLTDEEINQIIKGCIIDGSFLTFSNVVIFPPSEESSLYRGFFIAQNNLGMYQIVKSTKQITLASSSSQFIYLRSVYSFNGKPVPAFPSSSGTFVLKCVDGILTWVAE